MDLLKRFLLVSDVSIEINEFSDKMEKKWNNYAIQNKNSTFYHLIGWKKVIEKTYQHKSYYLYCQNENGDIIGILPLFLINNIISGRRLISVPFAPYCGVCCENEIVEKALIKEAINLSKDLDSSCFEIRDYSNRSSIYADFRNWEEYSTYEFDLSKGVEYLWKNTERSVRKNIKKGEKYNIKSVINRSQSLINEFYDLYAQRMRNLGTPVHDYNFFKNICDLFPKQFLIIHAELNDKIISSIFLLEFKDKLLGGWMSSLEEYSIYAPNNFVYWNSIKYGCENGFNSFDFGRSLKNSGGHVFKKRWGSIEVPLSNCYYPSTKNYIPPQEKFGKLIGIWKRMPLNATKMIGPKIRKFVV